MMRRVALDASQETQDSMDNLFIHLARYKFVSRLIKKSDEILEIGCGTGYGARYLANTAKHVDACDLDEGVLIEHWKQYKAKNLSFYKELPEEKLYDAVVCMEVIEHISKEDGQDLLKTIKGHMKEGAVCFISTPRKIANPSENRKKYHVHEYEYEEYREALEQVFSRALIFTQVDEIIATHNPSVAWNFVAVAWK